MKPWLHTRMMLREARGSRRRLVLFMSCLAIGVGAIVTVATLSASVTQSIRSEARRLLGADVKVRSRQPLPETLDEIAARAPIANAGAIRRTSVREQVTVAAASPRRGVVTASKVVELKVVDGVYPLYGDLGMDPPRALGELLTAETTVVAPEVLTALELSNGDTILIGGRRYRIAGTVLDEPDQLGFSMAIGPRVFLSAEGHARASALGRGFRVESEALFRLPAGSSEADVRAFERHVESELPGGRRIRVSTYLDAQPRLRRSLRRISQFLGLVGLLSLLIGSVGVAQTVRAWIAERIDAIAVMRCLGLRPREVVALYAGQTAVLGLIGSLLGAALGLAVAFIVPTYILPDLVPPEFVHPWQPWALGQGIVLGVGVSLVFSLSPLMDIRRIPPARVFVSEAEPVKAGRVTRLLTALVLVAGVWGAATWQGGSAERGAYFTAGLIVVVALLAAAARGLSALAARVPRRHGRLWIRHGLARVARPGAATTSSVVALGLGVMIVLAIHLVERNLSGQLRGEIPDAPSCLLINIEPEQWSDVRPVMETHGATAIQIVPRISARIRALDGVTVDELMDREERPSRWALRREQRLTSYDTLPNGNDVIAGALWSDPARDEISVEEGYAESLDIGLGSRVTIDVDGEAFDLVVTSIRSVNWRTPSANFFMVVEPGVLDDVPQMWIATAQLPPGGDQLLQDALAAAHPNITLIQVRDMLDKVLALLGRISIGVQLLGAFTVGAGILILAGSISAGAVRRGREVALLKTLGMTRREIAAVFAVEYALIGLAAAIIGGLAGGVLAWAVLTRLMELAWEHRPLTYLLTIACTIVLVVVAGLAASRRAMRVRPVEILRAE